MARIINGEIVLTRDEADFLIERLKHPDPEMIRKRNKALENIGKLEFNEDGTGFTVEIKDLDTEFLKNKIKERICIRLHGDSNHPKLTGSSI